MHSFACFSIDDGTEDQRPRVYILFFFAAAVGLGLRELTKCFRVLLRH
jgi:hypothetical protein